jgi:hypothetical protein
MSDESQQVELLDLDIESILSFVIGLTSTKAVQYLGVPVIEAKKAEKDLKRAQLSIDTTSFLVDKLEPYVDEEEIMQLRQVVSNLQFAYLRESN